MKSSKRSINFLWVAALLPAFVCMPALAAQQVAAMSVTGQSISWSPQVPHAKMVLTVSGGGHFFRHEFEAADSPSFSPYDGQGNSLPDGNYTWELTVIPRREPLNREDYENGRTNNDSSLMQQGRGAERQIESGYFNIVGGGFVDSSLVEPETAQKGSGDVRIEGDVMAGGTKNFAVPDPAAGDRAIYYAALEGPEAGTYFRGNAVTVDGEATIDLPEHFSKVTEAAGLTVQLTPLGGWSQLYVDEISCERLVVRDAEAGQVRFSFLVQGVRKGYADYQVERPADAVEQSN